MSLQDRRTIEMSFEQGRGAASARLHRLLHGLLPRLSCGQLIVEMPGGHRITLSGRAHGPFARVRIHSWRGLARIAMGLEIGFADAYAAGEVSSPDIADLLRLAAANASSVERIDRVRPLRYVRRLRHALNRNTRRGSRRNISAHYDLGNDFYRHWLDRSMTYSSALFSSPEQTLEDAQIGKLDRIINLLDVRGGESVLEIGIGWGGLAERLLQTRDCDVRGVTLSASQLDFARRRLAGSIARGRCDLRLQDYRDINGSFDRIVSIEMLEAVGEVYWSVYFEKLRSSLKPGGRAVLQVISIDEARFADYRRNPDFIQQRIFPGGMLPTRSLIAEHAAGAGLRLIGEELFGDSYARTLAIWRQRFEQAGPQIEPLGFDGRFRRMWSYYLDYCRVGFETSAVNVGLYSFLRS